MSKQKHYVCATCGEPHDAINTFVLMWVTIENGQPQPYQGHFCSPRCVKSYLTEFQAPPGAIIQ